MKLRTVCIPTIVWIILFFLMRNFCDSKSDSVVSIMSACKIYTIDSLESILIFNNVNADVTFLITDQG